MKPQKFSVLFKTRLKHLHHDFKVMITLKCMSDEDLSLKLGKVRSNDCLERNHSIAEVLKNQVRLLLPCQYLISNHGFCNKPGKAMQLASIWGI